jgi:shikimate dehydrogenase
VFGNPVEHSRSPEIHQMFAQSTGMTLSYHRVRVPDGQFNKTADEFMKSGYGFNVTVPCKRDAWQWVDSTSERADLAQAVNTVSRDEDGAIVGDTTDGRGLTRDIMRNLGWQIERARVLLVGAGGAASGVIADLMSESPAVLHIHNRTAEKATELAARFDDSVMAVSNETIESGYDLIINGTSAGLAGDDVSLPDHIIGSHSRCYDMIYSNDVTRFNAWSLARGAGAVSDGLGMLAEQAAFAFDIWFGVMPETREVIESMRNPDG